MDTTVSAPRVAVWRRVLLQGSETFVRGQVGALPTWKATLFGLERAESPISSPDDVVLFPTNDFGDKLGRKVFRRWRRSRRLERAIRASGAKVIHAHFMRDAWDVLPTARRLGLPLVVTAHGFDVTSWVQEPGWNGFVHRRRVRVIGKRAARVITVSQFLARTVAGLGVDPAKITVRYIGISTDRPAADPSAERSGLVFVGRLVDKKGVADLLEAISRSALGSQTRLTVVGGGRLRPALEQRAAELGVDAHFVGSATPDEVATLLRSAAVFAAPSKTADDGDSEGFGMVFLEAALAGLPVVSYRHGGVTEAVEDGVTGLLVDEGDVDALADAIDTMLGEPQRAAAMGRAGAQRVVDRFDLRDCTAELESLYVEVADGAR